MTGQPAPGPEQAVGDALRALSSDYPALPSTVADRLDRTLAELPDLAPPATTDVEPARPPRRRRRFFALSGAMAAVVAVVGFALAQPTGPQGPTSADSDTSEALDSGTAEAESPGDYAVTYSGNDYGDGGPKEIVGQRDPGLTTQAKDLVEPLSGDPVQRDACVALLEETYGGTVSAVDFGLYDGVPTMVAILDAADGGTSYAIAVGARCGADGPDLIAQDEIPPSR